MDFDGNSDATWEEFGDQRRSAPSPPPTITNVDLSLIDITTLEQLDAMRYDLDGDGWPSSAGETAWKAAFTSLSSATVDDDDGTRDPSSTYMGYELMESLDFEDADGDGTVGDKSIWAEGSTVAGAVAEGWVPIGDHSTNLDDSRFTAIFEGNDNMISNLYINRAIDFVGLFGYLSSGGEVRNLGIVGGSVTGNENVGGLVGRNQSYGSITACYATGAATATGNDGSAGSLVGKNDGTISGCYAAGTAEATASDSYAGCLVGGNNGTISECYATGNATATGDYGLRRAVLWGGMVVRLSASYAIGTAEATAEDGSAGGLVGLNVGTISASYATGNATGIGDFNYVGSLVGENSAAGKIRACYATGTATTGAIQSYTGGLVAINNGTIRASYATGNATSTGSNSYAGGLVGWNNEGSIVACYATGNATGTSGFTGGLVGNNSSSGTITHSYFDRDVIYSHRWRRNWHSL